METSIESMKLAVCKLVDLKTEYAEKKEIADNLYKSVKEAEQEVVDMLEKSGLDKFTVPGVGTATRAERVNWQTPKGIPEKKLFFKYVQERLGDEGFWTYATVNSQSMNSFCREQLESGEKEIPGLSAPVSGSYLRFNKARN